MPGWHMSCLRQWTVWLSRLWGDNYPTQGAGAMPRTASRCHSHHLYCRSHCSCALVNKQHIHWLMVPPCWLCLSKTLINTSEMYLHQRLTPETVLCIFSIMRIPVHPWPKSALFMNPLFLGPIFYVKCRNTKKVNFIIKSFLL